MCIVYVNFYCGQNTGCWILWLSSLL